jgi:hypothetical protein
MSFAYQSGSMASIVAMPKAPRSAGGLDQRHAIHRSRTDAYTAGDEIYTAVLPPSTGRTAP